MIQPNSNISNSINVKSLIPQKEPFVMVDQLLYYSDQKVEASLLLDSNNLFVKKNTFTEPGLIEHMAQTIALHTGYKYYLNQKSAPTGYIGSIKKIEIKELPKLGDKIITSATILHEILGVTLVNVSVELKGREIAIGQMKTVLAN